MENCIALKQTRIPTARRANSFFSRSLKLWHFFVLRFHCHSHIVRCKTVGICGYMFTVVRCASYCLCRWGWCWYRWWCGCFGCWQPHSRRWIECSNTNCWLNISISSSLVIALIDSIFIAGLKWLCGWVVAIVLHKMSLLNVDSLQCMNCGSDVNIEYVEVLITHLFIFRRMMESYEIYWIPEA